MVSLRDLYSCYISKVSPNLLHSLYKKMLHTFLANVVWWLHVSLILFVTVIPFTRQNWPILTLHLATVTSLIAHWTAGQDACFLTLVESVMRGIHPDESFVHQIVSPVYKIKDEEMKTLVWWVTPLLGSITLQRLWHLLPFIKRDVRFVLRTNRP